MKANKMLTKNLKLLQRNRNIQLCTLFSTTASLCIVLIISNVNLANSSATPKTSAANNNHHQHQINNSTATLTTNSIRTGADTKSQSQTDNNNSPLSINGITQQLQQQIAIVDQQQEQPTDISSMYVQIPIAEPGPENGPQQTANGDNEPTGSQSKGVESTGATSWTGPWPKKFQIGYIKQSDLHQVLIESLKNDPFVSISTGQSSAPTSSVASAKGSATSTQVPPVLPNNNAASKTIQKGNGQLAIMKTSVPNQHWPTQASYALQQQFIQRPNNNNNNNKNVMFQSANSQQNLFRDQPAKMIQQSLQANRNQYNQLPSRLAFNNQNKQLISMTNKNNYHNNNNHFHQQQQFQFAGFPSNMLKNQPIYTVNNFQHQSDNQLNDNNHMPVNQIQMGHQQLSNGGHYMTSMTGQAHSARPQKSNEYYSPWRPVTNGDKNNNEQTQIIVGSSKVSGAGQQQQQTDYSAINDGFDDGFNSPNKDATSGGSMNRHPMLNNYLDNLNPIIESNSQQEKTSKLSPAMISAKMNREQTKVSPSGGATKGNTKSMNKPVDVVGSTKSGSRRRASTNGTSTIDMMNSNTTTTTTSTSTTQNPLSDDETTTTMSSNATTTTTISTPTTTSQTIENETTEPDSESVEVDSITETDATTSGNGSTTPSTPTTTIANSGSSSGGSEQQDSTTTANPSTSNNNNNNNVSSTTNSVPQSMQMDTQQQSAVASSPNERNNNNNGVQQQQESTSGQDSSEVATQSSINQQAIGTATNLPTNNNNDDSFSSTTTTSSTTISASPTSSQRFDSNNSREETTPLSLINKETTTSGSSSADSDTKGEVEGQKDSGNIVASNKLDSISDEALLAQAVKNASDIGKTKGLNNSRQKNNSSSKKTRSSERLVQQQQASSSRKTPSTNNNNKSPNTKKSPSSSSSNRSAKQVDINNSTTVKGNNSKSVANSKSLNQKKQQRQNERFKTQGSTTGSQKITRMVSQSERLQQAQVFSMTAAQAQSTAQTLASLLLSRCMSSASCAHLLDICTTKQAMIPLPVTNNNNIDNQSNSLLSINNNNNNNSLAGWSMPVGLMSTNIISLTQALQADKVLKLFPQWKETIDNIVDQDTQAGYTLILPSNEAVEKIPISSIESWLSNSDLMGQIIDNHIIDSSESIEFLNNNNMQKNNKLQQTRVIRGKGMQVNQHRDKMVTINGKRVVYANQPAPCKY